MEQLSIIEMVLSIITSSIIVLGGIWAIFRDPINRFRAIMDGWSDQPERPGFQAIPGIPSRVRTLEIELGSHRVLPPEQAHPAYPPHN